MEAQQEDEKQESQTQTLEVPKLEHKSSMSRNEYLRQW